MQRLKLLITGDQGCGKSCLIRRYCEGAFEARYIPTVGVDYGARAVRLLGAHAGASVRANFYDTSGSPAYAIVRCEFYREAEGLLLVFDVGDGGALERLAGWLEEAQRCGLRAGAPVVLCGTRADGSGSGSGSGARPRAVRREAAEAWVQARAPGATYHEASAQSGQGCKEAVEALLAACVIEGSGAAGVGGGRAV
jgi:DnaJ family protein C protein 27